MTLPGVTSQRGLQLTLALGKIGAQSAGTFGQILWGEISFTR